MRLERTCASAGAMNETRRTTAKARQCASAIAISPGALRRQIPGPDRGRAGRDPARPARPRSGPGICRRRAPGDIAIALAHWRALAVVLLVSFIAPAEAQVLSSRIWPARDYTRLTLESRDEIKFTLFGVKDPERLVLDLELAELSPALLELNAKVAADDPYVQG